MQHVDLALSFHKNQQAVDDLVDRLEEEYKEAYSKRTPPRISVHRADLSDVADTEKLAREAEEEHSKPVDILVANAGYGERITDIEYAMGHSPIEITVRNILADHEYRHIPLDVFEHTLNVNLRAPFLLAKSVVPHMRRQRWGRIIFISSIAGYGAGLNGSRAFE
jgi:3-oxoacyl-[acyl-carrier protein] reductase